jgi:hypothetical protein
MFQLRFPEADIPTWATRYAYPGEADVENQVAPAAHARRFLMREEFLALCRWKTPRSQSRCARNRSAFIEAVTRISLETEDDELKIPMQTPGLTYIVARYTIHP